jgi:hypothetical protein
MAKSPVYGRGRNRKHRAKRQKNVPIHAAAANINMRGKKSRVEHCWCCTCIDMRDEIMYLIHKKEMRDGTND